MHHNRATFIYTFTFPDTGSLEEQIKWVGKRIRRMVWCYCKLLYHSLQVLTWMDPHCQQVHLSSLQLEVWVACILHVSHFSVSSVSTNPTEPVVSSPTESWSLQNQSPSEALSWHYPIFLLKKTRVALGFLGFEIAIYVQLGRMLECFMLKL